MRSLLTSWNLIPRLVQILVINYDHLDLMHVLLCRDLLWLAVALVFFCLA